MTDPAHRDLRRVVASLAAHLAEQVDGMLTDDRFAAGREALERLGDADQARDLGAVDPREAAWLAEELRHRWAAIGDVLLDPVAWMDAPDAVDGEEAVRLTVRVDGLEPGWTVAWSGATPDENHPAVATVTSSRPVTARVMGRGPQGRVILTAAWEPDTPRPSPMPAPDGAPPA